MQFWLAPTPSVSEGYRAIDLEPWQLAIREQEGLAPYPVLVIISASADLDPVHRRTRRGSRRRVMIITTCGKVQMILSRCDPQASPCRRSTTARSIWHMIIDQLAGTGLPRLLCEGGPRLHNDLLAAGVVDEVP